MVDKINHQVMKKILIILVLSMMAFAAKAQEIYTHHSAHIDELLKAQNEQPARGTTIDGFRVQIFNGNKGPKSRNRAYEIKGELEASAISNLDIYVLYAVPFWKVQIGNCTTRTEAEELRKTFLERFPDFAADAYIVPVKIQK